jgi:hypothetical protein
MLCRTVTCCLLCHACAALQGAPYGYTPFCDTNTDMEGFRFWKQVRAWACSCHSSSSSEVVVDLLIPLWAPAVQ